MREWRETSLGAIATWSGGMTPSKGNSAFWDNGTIPWLSSKEVVGGVLRETEHRVTEAAVRETSLRKVPANSVAVVVRSGILQHTFPVALVPFECTVNQDVKIAVAGPETTGPFLRYLLEAKASEILESLRKTGTTVQSIDVPAMLAMSVNLPPMDEQSRIVDLMQSTDANIAALEDEAAALDSLRAELVEKTLEDLPGEEVTLGEALTIVRGGSPRPIDDYFTDDEDGLNWVKIGDVPPDGKYVTSTRQKIRRAGLKKTRYIEAGSFILSNSMSFGRPYIMKIDGCIHDGWLALTDERRRFDQDFLYYLLRSRGVQEQFDRLAAGSGVRNLNIKVVGSVTVRLPSLPAQRVVVEQLTLLHESSDSIRRELDTARSLRAVLAASLFARDIRIPDSYSALVGVS